MGRLSPITTSLPGVLYILAHEGKARDIFDPFTMQRAYTFTAGSMTDALALCWPVIERDRLEAGPAHRGARVELASPGGLIVVNLQVGHGYAAASAQDFSILEPLAALPLANDLPGMDAPPFDLEPWQFTGLLPRGGK